MSLSLQKVQASSDLFGKRTTNLILKTLNQKNIKKLLSKRNFEYGPYQIGPGQPALLKLIIKISKKAIFIKGHEFFKETLELGYRVGGFYYVGGSHFSYQNVEVLYSSKDQLPRDHLKIIDLLKKTNKKIKYTSLQYKEYKGKDLIAGITSPKYIFFFYNMALRLNLIKKSVKKIFHQPTNQENVEISLSKTASSKFRFFSILHKHFL